MCDLCHLTLFVMIVFCYEFGLKQETFAVASETGVSMVVF